jgi:DNA-binding winged helix-turn-helix (wHTH) protein
VEVAVEHVPSFPLHHGEPQEVPVSPPVRRFLGLSIDGGKREVSLDGVVENLTRMEFDLLVALSDQPGIVQAPRDLLRAVWGQLWIGDGHVIETVIGRLRAKLGENGKQPRFIRTVRGSGYQFDPSPLHLHHVGYDSSMAILSLDPSDLPVLGWHPWELMGRFEVFIDDDWVRDNRPVVSAVAHSMTQTGMPVGPLPFAVLDAEGRRHLISVVVCGAVPSVEGFPAIIAHLLLDGGSAAVENSWPQDGHGTMCTSAISPRLRDRDQSAPADR